MDWTKSYVTKLVQNQIHDHNNKTKTPEHIFSYATEKIVEVATHKVLGVTIDDNLSWTNHVNELTNSQKLNIL